MKIEKIKIEKLLPAKYNPRKDLQPGDPEFEKLRRSVEEFGYVEPVIWNERTGVVVGGHQRLKVLQHLGYTEVDCVVLDIDEAKEKALNVALNKISGDWDMPLLTAPTKLTWQRSWMERRQTCALRIRRTTLPMKERVA